MKKLLPLLFLLAFATTSRATLTFTLLTPVCDTNGVLVIQFIGFSLAPFHTHWIYGARTADHPMTGYYDTLYNYNGAQVTKVYLYDSTNTTLIDSGTFTGTPPLYFSMSSVNSVCPAKPTVSAVAYGTSPFTYSWYNISTGEIVGTAATIHVAASGIYGIWITGGSGGCGSGSAATGLYDTVVAAVSFTDSIATRDANCTNGSAKLDTVTGVFTPPLSYLWSNGSTADSITGLTSGYYYLTVTDSSGCSYQSAAYVYPGHTVGVTTTAYLATCAGNDGAITCHPSGGIPPYTFLWSNGGITQFEPGLTPGTYTITVTDSSGCTGTNSGTVNGSAPISVSYASSPSSCISSTGTLSLVISGGTPPYTDTIYASPIQTSAIATGLAAGTYMYRVVDAHGCVQNGYAIVPRADNPVIDFISSPATCMLSDGSLNAHVSGGTSPYTYSWNAGASSSSITSQPSGWYTVTITDGNGCSQTNTGHIPDYSTLIVGVSSVPATCIFTNNATISAMPSGGTAPYTYSWSNGGTSATETGLHTGPYWVYVTDAAGCTAYAYNYAGYNTSDSDCYCRIKGIIYHDANVNCTRQVTEPGIPNVQVYCSGGIGYAYTDDSGKYSFMVPTGTYTITETVQAYYPLAGCQPNNIIVSAVADSGCVHEVDFANIYDSVNDLQISTWDYTQPIAGQPYTQISVIHNAGTVRENSPVAAAKTDPQLFGAAFLPSGFYGNSASEDYNTLAGGGLSPINPGGSQWFLRHFNVPGYLPIGTSLSFNDTLAYIAPLDSWITDYTSWNNVNTFTTQTVSSYPANFKEVTPRGVGANGVIPTADSNLQYMIHFQNTGTYTAENIVIIDTLDNNLNLASFHPIFESAPCTVTQSSNGKIVKFTFRNINLPPSSGNPVTSNGMLVYGIKMKPGLAYGNQIRNKASIYFDYNTPIQTNTTLNTIGWPLDVNNFEKTNDFFSVYPNPAGNSFNALINSDASLNNAHLIVSDITGKLLINQTLALVQGSQTVSVDVSRFAAGIYLVSVNEEGRIQTKKLVIMR